MTELRIGNRVLKNNTMIAIAVMSFVAIFFFNAPFPVLVIVAVLAFLLTFCWKRGMATTLAVCCAVGAVLFELM